ncbi:MAG: hypothetical protein ACYDIE_08770 [Candidatus Krumholzibacteriia bacterium]
MPVRRSWGLLIVLALLPGSARAFHDGGTATCAACHVMHASEDGLSVPTLGQAGETLLRGGTASDTCLRCHAAYGQFAGGLGFGPGGDFYWLTRSWTWFAGGVAVSSRGEAHGHNVVAPAYGLGPDPVRSVAPGGAFPSAQLGCTSCHDPHGRPAFRLLYGAGEGPLVDGARFLFTAPAPLALGNSVTTLGGVPGGGDETDGRHTVYKSGLSEWCGNCHGPYHDEGIPGFHHPSGEQLGAGRATQYNRYVSAEDPFGGTVATAYWGLVPFEAVGADLALVDPAAATAGPAPSDRVMCLTCHRAHAGPFRAAGRWDFDAALMIDSHPATGDAGASASDVARKYYSYTFVPTEATLCHKCHREVPGSTLGPALPTAP